jgi:hypothetical protein
VENQFGILLIFLEGADSYNFNYSGVARKNRCVAGMVNIT